MARLIVKGESLHLSLSGWEQLGSLHADIRVPLGHVVRAEIMENPYRVLRGFRAPGLGIPGVILLGTIKSHGKKDFVAIYRHRTAVMVHLRDEPFERFIVSCDEPEKIVQRLNQNSNLN